MEVTIAMTEAESFKIDIPQTTLDDLRNRLQQVRWTYEVEGSGWSMGTNLAYMRELVDHWLNSYDWRKHEADINKLSHFRADIGGIGVHFIHERGKGPNPTPIVLTHGWPDSFYRFHKIIPMLTDPASYGADSNTSFDVIVPSLPGFGFSDRHAKTADQTADLWAKLMKEVLGYEHFIAAGGDLGGAVTMSLANRYPDAVTAIYLTDVGYPNGSEDSSSMSAAEREYAGKCQQWWYTEGAYNALQSTKPQTLAIGLNDSPAGLAAWIIEKFYAWSDNKGDLETRFTKDELLTNIMIYWVTQTIGSSIRTYLENARAMYANGGGPRPARRSEVPAAVASFPGEMVIPPREWAERTVNLKRWTEMPQGGHFAAWEVPELLANDLREFVSALQLE
jgi:pimeloyl-ACP methyl ester carboxylesterase